MLTVKGSMHSWGYFLSALQTLWFIFYFFKCSVLLERRTASGVKMWRTFPPPALSDCLHSVDGATQWVSLSGPAPLEHLHLHLNVPCSVYLPMLSKQPNEKRLKCHPVFTPPDRPAPSEIAAVWLTFKSFGHEMKLCRLSGQDHLPGPQNNMKHGAGINSSTEVGLGRKKKKLLKPHRRELSWISQ